jgi:hypothetical protein
MSCPKCGDSQSDIPDIGIVLGGAGCVTLALIALGPPGWLLTLVAWVVIPVGKEIMDRSGLNDPPKVKKNKHTCRSCQHVWWT